MGFLGAESGLFLVGLGINIIHRWFLHTNNFCVAFVPIDNRERPYPLLAQLSIFIFLKLRFIGKGVPCKMEPAISEITEIVCGLSSCFRITNMASFRVMRVPVVHALLFRLGSANRMCYSGTRSESLSARLCVRFYPRARRMFSS